MAVRREQILNKASTTVNEALDASETVITVTDGSVFPADGDYRLIIEAEVVLVTDRVTNDLTVVRGVDGTTAVTHSTAVAIDTIVTAGAIDQLLNDVSAGGLHRPARRLVDSSGVVLTASDFTAVNHGSTVVADEADGSISMFIDESSSGVKLLVKTAPSTPYKVRAKIEPGAGFDLDSSGTVVGLVMRESSTGKFVHSLYEFGDQLQPATYTNATTFQGFYIAALDTECDCPWIWLELEDNGTTIFFRYSSDGINFFEIFSVSRTDFMAGGPNQVGWVVSNRGGNGNDHYETLKSWEEIDLS